MNNNQIIKTNKKLSSKIWIQIGTILTLELSLLLGILFVESRIIIIIQLILIPVFIEQLYSKLHKPIVDLTINLTEHKFIFRIAIIGNMNKTICIRFEDITIRTAWQQDLQRTLRVIKIFDKKRKKIVIALEKQNIEFLIEFIKVLNKLKDNNIIQKNQIIDFYFDHNNVPKEFDKK